MNVMYKLLRLFGILIAFTLVSISRVSAVDISTNSILEDHKLWEQYRTNFIKSDGRVIDTLNKRVSHSEGQGYAMVLAVAANDRETFEAVYKFANENLAIRSDALFAWLYNPANTPPVSDKNNASDGDLLIAWALLEADARGWGKEYEKKAEQILNDLKGLVIDHPIFGRLLMPGQNGFQVEDGFIFNPSYWVFPALERISKLTGSSYWKRLLSSGEQIIMQHLDTGGKAAPDWIKIRSQSAELYSAQKKLFLFGYEAIRIPLYLLLADTTDQNLAYRIIDTARLKEGSSSLKRFDMQTNEPHGVFEELGYRTITAVADCIRSGNPIPSAFMNTLDENYYPATLQLLSLLALEKRPQSC